MTNNKVKVITSSHTTIVLDEHIPSGYYYNANGFSIQLNHIAASGNRFVYSYKVDDEADLKDIEHIYFNNPRLDVYSMKKEKTGHISLTNEQYRSLVEDGYDIKDITTEVTLKDIKDKVDKIYDFLFNDEIPADQDSDDYVEFHADEAWGKIEGDLDEQDFEEILKEVGIAKEELNELGKPFKLNTLETRLDSIKNQIKELIKWTRFYGKRK